MRDVPLEWSSTNSWPGLSPHNSLSTKSSLLWTITSQSTTQTANESSNCLENSEMYEYQDVVSTEPWISLWNLGESGGTDVSKTARSLDKWSGGEMHRCVWSWGCMHGSVLSLVFMAIMGECVRLFANGWLSFFQQNKLSVVCLQLLLHTCLYFIQ